MVGQMWLKQQKDRTEDQLDQKKEVLLSCGWSAQCCLPLSYASCQLPYCRERGSWWASEEEGLRHGGPRERCVLDQITGRWWQLGVGGSAGVLLQRSRRDEGRSPRTESGRRSAVLWQSICSFLFRISNRLV